MTSRVPATSFGRSPAFDTARTLRQRRAEGGISPIIPFRLAGCGRSVEAVPSLATSQSSGASTTADRVWGAMVVGGLLAVIAVIVGIVRLLNPPPTVLATVTLEKGAGSTSIQLAKAGELRVVLNARAVGRMDRTDFGDELARSQLTLSSSNPNATVRCSAHNGWSNSGNEEKMKRVPRIKEAENACSPLKVAQGRSTITIALDWKGRSPSPDLTALVVVP